MYSHEFLYLRWTSLVIVFAYSLAAVSIASAETYNFDYEITPLDVLDGKIPWPKEVILAPNIKKIKALIGNETCELTFVADGIWSLDNTCKQRMKKTGRSAQLAVTNQKKGSPVVSVNNGNRVKKDDVTVLTLQIAIDIKDRTNQAAALTWDEENGKVVIYDQKRKTFNAIIFHSHKPGWSRSEADEQGAFGDPEIKKRLVQSSGKGLLLVRTGTGDRPELYWSNAIENVAAESNSSPASAEHQRGPAPGTQQTAGKSFRPDWCIYPPGPNTGRLKAYTFCFDATDDRALQMVWTNAPNHTIQPNRSIWIVVQHYSNTSATIAVGGVRGLSAGAFLDDTKTKSGDRGYSETPKSETVRKVRTTASFAPRVPGDADISIEVRDRIGQQIKLSRTLEVIVEQRYIGAFRLGFGLALGGAVDRDYAADLAPGSSTAEIVQTGGGDTDIEIVLGFSAFWYDALVNQGRSYIQRSAWSYIIPSLYFGVGAISQANDGVEAFQSLHFGLEWEPVRSFSVSLDAVYRRVKRLRDGLSLGDDVAENAELTTRGFRLGWGLVVSVSPEFMQMANPSPSTQEGQ